MNEPENKFGAPGDSAVDELRQEVQSLRSLLSCSLALLFVFSFCVNVYLFRQASSMSMEATRASQMVTAWGSGGPAQIQAIEFWNRLNDFARTHPDFAPTVNKYSQFINIRSTGPAKK